MISVPSPTTRQWTQTNNGEILGTLFATQNINFDQAGYLKLAYRPTALFHNVSSFDTITSIDYLAGSPSAYYAMTGGHVFQFQSSGSTPTDLNGSGRAGSIKFDGRVWQGRWYISQTTSFSYYDGSSWTTGLGSLSNSTSPHPLCVFESLNYLAIGDLNTVKLYNTSHVLQTTLTIPSNFEVRWIRYLNNNIYIGTRNIYGGDAEMFVWDGTGSAAQGSYAIHGNWIFSGEVYESSIAVITSRGQLLKFNGGGFASLANLPVYYTPYSWYGGTGYTNGKVEQRGMVADGDMLYINLDGSIFGEQVYLPNQPSGLWVYDPNVGLYHRAGQSYSKARITSSVSWNTSTDTATIASYSAPTGTMVYFTGTSAGLISGRYYFLIRVTSTTLKLALTYDDAIAGTAVDVTSNPGFDTLYFQENLDFGNSYMSQVQSGAVSIISDLDANPYSSGEMTSSQIMWGAANIENATQSASVKTLQTLTRGENRGFFITQKISTYKLLDTWQKIFARFNNVFEGNDKVIIKYRIKNRKGLPIRSMAESGTGATWTSTTTFTTTSDLTQAQDGDEINIIGGSGAGNLVHISGTPSYSAGTWTVTVDAAPWGVATSDVSSFIVDNWKKIGTGTESNTQNFVEVAIPQLGNRSTWIQFKVELRGNAGTVIFDNLNIVNVTDKPAS